MHGRLLYKKKNSYNHTNIFRINRNLNKKQEKTAGKTELITSKREHNCDDVHEKHNKKTNNANVSCTGNASGFLSTFR